MLVHAGIAELAGEREEHGRRTTVGGTDAEHDAKRLVFGLKVVVLAGQRQTAGGAGARQRECRAALRHAGGLQTHLAEERMLEGNPRALGEAAHLLDQRRGEAVEQRQKPAGLVPEGVAIDAGQNLDGGQVAVDAFTGLLPVSAAHLPG